MFPFLDVLIVALIVIALSGFRIAQEYERGVVFRLGRYKGLRGPGLYWIVPKVYDLGHELHYYILIDEKSDWLTPIWTSAAFGFVILMVSIVMFRKRDY